MKLTVIIQTLPSTPILTFPLRGKGSERVVLTFPLLGVWDQMGGASTAGAGIRMALAGQMPTQAPQPAHASVSMWGRLRGSMVIAW